MLRSYLDERSITWPYHAKTVEAAHKVSFYGLGRLPIMKSLDADCHRRSLSRETWRDCGGECGVEEPGGKL